MAQISTADEALLDHQLGFTRPNDLEMPEVTNYEELILYADGLASVVGVTLQDETDWTEDIGEEEIDARVDAVVYGELMKVCDALEFHEEEHPEALQIKERIGLILELLEGRIEDLDALLDLRDDDTPLTERQQRRLLENAEDDEEEKIDFFRDSHFQTVQIEESQ